MTGERHVAHLDVSQTKTGHLSDKNHEFEFHSLGCEFIVEYGRKMLSYLFEWFRFGQKDSFDTIRRGGYAHFI